MADTTENIHHMMGRLTIASQGHSRTSTLHRTEVEDAKGRLVQAVEKTAARAQEIRALFMRDSDDLNQQVAAISNFRKRASDLESLLRSFNDASEDYIVAHLLSVGEGTSSIRQLLSYFENDIKDIVHSTLANSTNDDSTMRFVLEECYKQSLDHNGSLNPDNYFDSLDESFLESPYDPDFESEEYYEHENRLAVDADYAESEYMRQERKYDEKTRDREYTSMAWLSFWLQALANCESGTTIFWPLADRQSKEPALSDPPKYLFRAFDSKSSGISNLDIVSSLASQYQVQTCKTDLLSLDRTEAAEKLQAHLNKSPFGGEGSDNLMSWSSSLLFVIQYALWRYQKSNHSLAEVSICAVDTTKFPRGQFARDTWLIGKCQSANKENSMLKNLSTLRKMYDNGEYLTQGTLYHKARSCVFSLESLVSAGLYQLYPEFEDPAARNQWTKRVKELRLGWEAAQQTSKQEIQTALRVAKMCFKQFEAVDMALLLLMFKNRSVRDDWAESGFHSSHFYVGAATDQALRELPYRFTEGYGTVRTGGRTTVSEDGKDDQIRKEI